MNLNQLTYFAVTARHQHFTRAAEELFISQPSLSYAISTLEEELGTRLFEKKGRNIVLTKYGKLFLSHVERALAEIEQGKLEIAKLSGSGAGHVDVGYPTAGFSSLLSQLISQFLALPGNGEATFTCTHGHSSELIAGLKSQKFDVTFGCAGADDPDIAFTPLFALPPKVLVPEGHPLAGFAELSLCQLADYPLVLDHQADEDAQCEAKLARHFSPNIICRADDELSLLRMVAAGCGVALVLHADPIDGFPIRAVPITDPPFQYEIGMAQLRGRYLSPMVERFLGFAAEHLRRN